MKKLCLFLSSLCLVMLMLLSDMSFAYNVTKDLRLGGYIKNKSAVRLFDDRTNELEAGDMAMVRNTFFMDVDWEITDNFSFKGIGRAVYDASYAINDRCNGVDYDGGDEHYMPGPDDLEMEEQFDPREYYLAYHTNNLVIRAGRQQIVWGESDNLRMADVINPLDLSWDWNFPTWEDIRIPLHMIDVKLMVPDDIVPTDFIHNLRLEFVLNPQDFRPNQIAPYGTNWDPGLPAPPFYDLVREQQEEDLPGRDFGDTTEGGMRVRAKAGKVDFSLFTYYQRSDNSVNTFDPGHAEDPRWPVEYDWPYKTTVGGTFTYDWVQTATLLRGECAFVNNQPFTKINSDPQLAALGIGADDYTEKDVFSFMLGFDRYTWIRWLNDRKTFYFSGQFFQSFIQDAGGDQFDTGYGDDNMGDKQTVFTLLVNTEYMFGQIKPEVVFVHSVTEECGFVDYKLEYEPTYTTSFTLGVRNIWGNHNNAGLWGSVRENDQVYFEVKRTF